MELNLINPGHEYINIAFGIEPRRLKQLKHNILQGLNRLHDDNPDAKWSEAAVVIARCCDTKEEAIVMCMIYAEHMTTVANFMQTLTNSLNSEVHAN